MFTFDCLLSKLFFLFSMIDFSCAFLCCAFSFVIVCLSVLYFCFLCFRDVHMFGCAYFIDLLFLRLYTSYVIFVLHFCCFGLHNACFARLFLICLLDWLIVVLYVCFDLFGLLLFDYFVGVIAFWFTFCLPILLLVFLILFDCLMFLNMLWFCSVILCIWFVEPACFLFVWFGLTWFIYLICFNCYLLTYAWFVVCFLFLCFAFFRYGCCGFPRFFHFVVFVWLFCVVWLCMFFTVCIF